MVVYASRPILLVSLWLLCLLPVRSDELSDEVDLLRREVRHDQALKLLEERARSEDPEVRSRAASLLAGVTLEADLLKRLGTFEDLRRVPTKELLAPLAALALDGRNEIVLARFALLLGDRTACEEALGRACDKDASLKRETDLLVASLRGEAVPRGGYFRYRGRWLPMETRDRWQALDEALAALEVAGSDLARFPFPPSATEPNFERFGKPTEGEFLREAAGRVRAAADDASNEARACMVSYARDASLRKRLLDGRQALAEPRQKALELIGRYEKAEQPQVDAFRHALELAYAEWDDLWKQERSTARAFGDERAERLLVQLRARAEALAAIDRYLAGYAPPGLGEAHVAPARNADTTPRHFLPGREQSTLEDVLWVRLHFLAGRLWETTQRCGDMLRRSEEITPWERMVLEETWADAIDAYNERVATSLDAEERRFVVVLNRYRRVLGLRPFEVEERLVASARKHSEEMVRLGYFGHMSPVPRNRWPSDRAHLEGYAGGVGENCIIGSCDGPGAFECWYHSPGHHRNLVGGGPQSGVGAWNGHAMWTMVQGGDDATWRFLHADLPPSERRTREQAVQALSEALTAEKGTPDAERAAAAALLPDVLPDVAGPILAATNDAAAKDREAWVEMARFVIEAPVGAEWRAVQVAMVGAAISALAWEPNSALRQAAFDLVRPHVDDTFGYDPLAIPEERVRAALEIARHWQDVAQYRFRQADPKAPPPKDPRHPWRAGDGPHLDAPLKPLTPAQRLRLARANGGGEESERAVELGLAWLARVQDRDGAWRGRTFVTCDPALRGHETEAGIGSAEWEIALTGLSLLAFASAGNTTVHGRHAEVVSRGARFLVAQLVDYGRFDTPASHYMYAHAIATQALCELYAYSGDPFLGQAAQLCVDYLMYAQHRPSGGWRYSANEAGDTSVTGWVVMALHSAKKARLDLGGQRGALRFIDSVTRPPYHYIGYTNATDGGTLRLGAIASVCRLLLERRPEDPRVEMNLWRLKAALPARGQEDFYAWYYATIAMFLARGEFWKAWSGALLPTLLDGQVSSQGPFQGSWPPDGAYGGVGGRIYETALGVLMLTTWYRHDPQQEPDLVSFSGNVDEEAAPFLEAIRKAPDEHARAIASAQAIDRFGAALGPVLLRRMRDPKETLEARQWFSALLPDCCRREHEGALLAALEEETDAGLQEVLLRTLEGVSTARSQATYVRALASQSAQVRRFVARALGRIGDPATAPALSARLLEEKDEECRKLIADALARIESRRAMVTIVEDASTGDAAGRLALLEALELLEQGGVTERLLGARKQERALYDRALVAMREHGCGCVVPILLILLESGDRDTRAEAIKLLTALTGLDFGYDPGESQSSRRDAIDRWKAWWRAEQKR